MTMHIDYSQRYMRGGEGGKEGGRRYMRALKRAYLGLAQYAEPSPKQLSKTLERLTEE